MVRCVAKPLRVDLGQPHDRLHRMTCGHNKLGRYDPTAVPIAATQVQVSNPRHGVHVGVDSRSELAPHDAVDLRVAVCIAAPGQILTPDADWREDTFEQQFVDIPPVGERHAFSQPVGSAVAVSPLRSRFEIKWRVTARLLESGGLRR